MKDDNRLVAVTKLSTKGTSIRMTLPREIAIILEIEEGDHLGFYEKDEHIEIRKVL